MAITEFLTSIIVPDDLEQSIIRITFLMIFIGLAIIPTFIFIHWLMPKTYVNKYWSEPYFSSGEIDFLSSFPMTLMRTNMLCATMIWPQLGKRRGLIEAYFDAPAWYLRLIRTWYAIFFGSWTLGLTTLVAMMIYYSVTEDDFFSNFLKSL
jgi:hypothetical protein